MLRFRPRPSEAVRAPAADLLAVSELIDDAMRPGHFLVAPSLDLTWVAARSETIAWEIFRGRLLDAPQTRLQQTFLSWHVMDREGSLLSVKLDIYARCIHVTRGLQCHVWEGYDAGGGTIDSRETIQWTRELVGTIALDHDELHDELICLIWQALVGTSRLPLTSVEAPLPAYVFGQLHYLYRAESHADEPASASWEDWLRRGLRMPIPLREEVKLVEFVLRHVTPADLPRMADVFQTARAPLGEPLPGWASLEESLRILLRALFNNVSLSPYTSFVDNTLAWIDILTTQSQALSPSDTIDFLSHLLRKLGRHLTAYDLVTFHHRGANYPDALLLDAVLKAYLRMLAAWPTHFDVTAPRSALRRRALRQGCLMRRHYEGHFVPDAPTSPGENARVMPAPHDRVPDEQLTQPHRRRRRLFAADPLPSLLSPQARSILAQSMLDLENVAERVELGLGVFIDRPLGYAKAIAEPDLTPLFAHEAFSPSLARRRLLELQRLCADLDISLPDDVAARFEQDAWPVGVPHTQLAECPRPVAALADVRRVADDFVILRTLPRGLAELSLLFYWRPALVRFRLPFFFAGRSRWCVQVLNEQQQPVLAVADATGQRRLEMRVDVSQGYATRAGVEFPRAGLQIITVWEDTDEPSVLRRHDLTNAPFGVPICQTK